MRIQLLSLVTVVLGGCAVAADPAPDSETERPASALDTHLRGHLSTPVVVIEPEIDVPEPERVELRMNDSAGGDPDLCLLAVEQDGPCSLACDNAAVIDEFVPEGTCLVFACDLTTGERVRVGGCH